MTMSYHPTAALLFKTSGSHSTPPQHNRRRRKPPGLNGMRFLEVPRVGLCILLCGLALFLAACGPERGGSEEDLVAETVRIAEGYAQNNDLNQARVQLESLDAANPTQFLIYLAERRVDEEPDAPTTEALVRFALALGLQSRPVVDYGVAHNLLVNAAAPTFAVAPQAGEAAIALAPVTSEERAAAPAAPAAAVALSATTSSTVAAPGAVALPTATAQPAAGEAAPPIPTTISKPLAQASNSMNVRGGPGTDYPVVSAINAGDQVEIIGKNPQSDWWQVLLPAGLQGWVYGPLVQTLGDTAGVAVAANIPAPPPTATPAPVVEAPPAESPSAEQPSAEPPPAEQPPAEQAPTEQPPAAPPSDKPYFRLVEKRMWSKAENGDCRGQHLLRIHVVDANGNRLNGVALQGIYIGEIIVTGAQGKGDGIIEYDLHGSGEGFRVIRDVDGREASSDPAEGFTTRSIDIPEELLIPAGYCSDHETCQVFYNSWGCHGHHSWEAKFQRNY
jgi:uncharacterized protein YraI